MILFFSFSLVVACIISCVWLSLFSNTSQILANNFDLILILGGFGGAGAVDEEDEDALMQRALEMSMREMLTVNTPPSTAGAAGAESKTAAEEEEDVSMFVFRGKYAAPSLLQRVNFYGIILCVI